MNKWKAQPTIDTRTLDTLLDELRDAHARLGAKLQALQAASRLSEEYHDSLAEIYTLMTLLKCLASDIQSEIDRLDDQLPDN